MYKYHGDEPYSSGAKNILIEYIGKKEANEVITKSDVYTRSKQHRKPKKFSPIYVHSRRELSSI